MKVLPIPAGYTACAWCQKVGGAKVFSFKTANGQKSFCSEVCFTQCRRASFKRNKTCDWCRHIRHTVNYVDLQDGDHQLQFCSDKCLNQYKMNIFCKETQEHLQLHPHLNKDNSSNKSNVKNGALSEAGSVNGNCSNNSGAPLITPDLWLKDCRSESPTGSDQSVESPQPQSLSPNNHNNNNNKKIQVNDVKDERSESNSSPVVIELEKTTSTTNPSITISTMTNNLSIPPTINITPSMTISLTSINNKSSNNIIVNNNNGGNISSSSSSSSSNSSNSGSVISNSITTNKRKTRRATSLSNKNNITSNSKLINTSNNNIKLLSNSSSPRSSGSLSPIRNTTTSFNGNSKNNSVLSHHPLNTPYPSGQILHSTLTSRNSPNLLPPNILPPPPSNHLFTELNGRGFSLPHIPVSTIPLQTSKQQKPLKRLPQTSPSNNLPLPPLLPINHNRHPITGITPHNLNTTTTGILNPPPPFQGPLPQPLTSPMASILPPATVLIPYPILLPIPIPIPIPLPIMKDSFEKLKQESIRINVDKSVNNGGDKIIKPTDNKNNSEIINKDKKKIHRIVNNNNINSNNTELINNNKQFTKITIIKPHSTENNAPTVTKTNSTANVAAALTTNSNASTSSSSSSSLLSNRPFRKRKQINIVEVMTNNGNTNNIDKPITNESNGSPAIRKQKIVPVP